MLVDNRLYRDPDTWPVRERIVSLARGSRAQEVQGAAIPSIRPLGTRAIAALLARDGIPAPRGGAQWSKTTVGRVIGSHDGLNHIPALPGTEETAVSTEHDS